MTTITLTVSYEFEAGTPYEEAKTSAIAALGEMVYAALHENEVLTPEYFMEEIAGQISGRHGLTS